MVIQRLSTTGIWSDTSENWLKRTLDHHRDNNEGIPDLSELISDMKKNIEKAFYPLGKNAVGIRIKKEKKASKKTSKKKSVKKTDK